MRLFSYCIPIDDGAAPNPFFGVCTLNICKPVIRRVAKVGDWVVGVGSKNVNGVDYSEKLVYAMKITKVISMQEYDDYCKSKLPQKIPDINYNEYRRRVGDSIYDFSKSHEVDLRRSVHTIQNRDTDLGGKNTLLSEHFYYFGNEAICIPHHLRGIIKQGQGHKSNANEPYKQEFIFWLESKGFVLNKLYGSPQIKVNFKDSSCDNKCADVRCESAHKDEKLSYC